MISCDSNELYYGPVMWVFELIQKAYGIGIVVDERFHVSIGHLESHDIQVSADFYTSLLHQNKYGYEDYFKDSAVVLLDDGRPDFISTIFYLVNGFQEYGTMEDRMDKYGRLDFQSSFQHRYDVLEQDLVKSYVAQLLQQISSELQLPQKKSRIFLSHDIDSVYGSLKYDGFWAAKKVDIRAMLKVVFQTVLRRPPWFNIDKVANLNDEWGVRSCYYWIVQNGRDHHGIKNGDYDFRKEDIQAMVGHVKHLGNEVGLHKSTMNSTFEMELRSIRSARSNRFHFLKIDNPESYDKMEASGIESDSSIGFAYHMGFKNNFGMPYYPYDIKRGKRYEVLEIPLQVMDGMFDIKDEESGNRAFQRITNFIENNRTDAIISILWHNSELTDFAYKWSFECYKRLLSYFYEEKFETVLPSQLVEEYKDA